MCELRSRKKAEFRPKEIDKVREDGGKEIRERLEGLGYNHKIEVLGDTFDQHCHVKRSKELTEQGWKNIREDMIQWMEATRVDHRTHDFAYHKNLAAGFLPHTLPPRGPSVQEFFCFSLVKEILDLPSQVRVDIQTLHDIIPAMPRMFQEFREMVAAHDHLLAIMGPNNLCVDIFRKRAFLGLACNAFVCSPSPYSAGY
ncbi:hypothetical protein IW262DRAFT_1498604 [Armillaria fumosa]|nr:hypothetical protein IW262DRAFT_1498604 [Armillaria fumosa]